MQHILQAPAIQCGLERCRHAGCRHVEKFQHTGVGTVQEAQLDHADHFVVLFQWQQQHAHRLALTEAGIDGQVTVRHLFQMNQAPPASGLSDQTFIVVECLRGMQLFTAEAITGDPFQRTAVFAHIHCRDRGIDIGGQKFQYRSAQLTEQQLAHALLRQLALPGTLPSLPLQHCGVFTMLFQRFAIGRSQQLQVTPPEQRQQTGETEADQQVNQDDAGRYAL